MLDIMLAVIFCSLLGSLALMALVSAWYLFEDTELWEILKEKMTRKDE